MKVWLIRHAEAADRTTFDGTDAERPLTERGIKRSKHSFAKLARIYKKPDLVFASHAVRAWETADHFCEAFGISSFNKTSLLNPGTSLTKIRRLVESVSAEAKCIVLIGHEPDFSEAVSQWVADGALNIILKKGGLIALDLDDEGNAELSMIVPSKILIDG